MREDQDQASLLAALAGLLESAREEILRTFEQRLRQMGSMLIREPVSRKQLLTNGEQILDDVIESLRTGQTVIYEGARTLAWQIGTTRATQGLHPSESLRASAELFDVIIAAVADQLDDAHASAFLLAAQSVQQSMTMRIREASASYVGLLLSKIHRAQVDERQRIARELHDRVGAGISVAHRHLELYDVYRESEPVMAGYRIATAQQALREAMDGIRELTSDLRVSEPWESLEKSLRSYLHAAAIGDVSAKVIVNGNETWASPEVRDEVFLTIREAIRNALTHGQARTILVRVDIAPDELHATIDDDGVGFNVEEVGAGGGGLPAMAERAALLGGNVRVSSFRGQGTHVELLIPLSGGKEGGGRDGGDR